MYSALPAARCDVATQAGQSGSGAHDSEHPETIETRLWLEEHDWLFTVLRSEGKLLRTGVSSTVAGSVERRSTKRVLAQRS